MDPTKLIIEHPFSIEEKFKKTDLEKMRMSTNVYCGGSMNFAYKEGGVLYLAFCDKLPDTHIGVFGIYLLVKLGNVREIKAKYRITLPSINDSYDYDHLFNNSSGNGLIVLYDIYFKPDFFVNDELIVKIDGTLIFERPLISISSFPINIRWNIKEKELKAKISTNGYLMTSKFKISPNSTSKYSLVLCPNGINDESRGKVVKLLFVELGKSEKIEAYSTLSCGNLSINYCLLHEKDDYGCGPKISSTDELFLPSKKFFVNGEMTLKLKTNFIIKKEEPSIKLPGLSSKKFKTEKDFKLIVDGKDIPVHKSLLIESSQYFSWTFNSKSKESTKKQMVISGFSFKTVDTVIKLLYGISPTLSLPDLIPLLYFSDKYIITDIKALVENHLLKNIFESNVCQLIHFSTIFHATKLRQKSLQFLLQCLRKFSPVNDLDLLDKDGIQSLSDCDCEETGIVNLFASTAHSTTYYWLQEKLHKQNKTLL